MFNRNARGIQMQVLIQRDTKAWVAQVWFSFLVALFLCGVGLAFLPGQDLDRAFMVMGYVFCLTAAFVLSKFVRDSQKTRRDPQAVPTPMFGLVVWGGFGVAMGLTAWGLLRMNINDAYKAFLGVSWLYLITCAFTLAKTLRDRYEADLAEARQEARMEGRNEARQDARPAPRPEPRASLRPVADAE